MSAHRTDAQQAGLAHGDRVGVYLQSVPHYVVILLALRKIGAIGVRLNPMYRARSCGGSSTTVGRYACSWGTATPM